MRLVSTAVLTLLSVAIIACGDGGGGGGSFSSSDSSQLSPTNYPVSPLAQTEEVFDNMTPLEQYAMVNKLLSALYKGIPADQWFELSGGLDPLVAKNDAPGLDQIRSEMGTPLAHKYSIIASLDQKYYFSDKQRPLQYPLAMLYEFPLSRDYFIAWMAYQLANTILFSPALELATCDYIDIQNVFDRLVSMMEGESEIRDIVYEHMISQENWRRFRSPEDNTREMMEIFLGRFMDEEVPLAALACKNWSFSDKPSGYQLVIGDEENDAPQQILDTTVTTCTDFYRAVADHADLIPKITADLVNLLVTDASAGTKQKMVDTILSLNPRRFEDIFVPILFSQEFLLDTERPGRFEERFFNIAHRISWWADTKFFKHINHTYASSSYPSLKNMHQAAMTYKLGRFPEVPLDTLSFSYFHKAIREKLLLDRRSDESNINDGGWQMDFVEVDVPEADFVGYLFLAVISRKPTTVESDTLNQIFNDRGYTRPDHRKHRAMIVLEYLSRLSETYYLNAWQ